MKKKLMSLGLIVSSVFMFVAFLAPQLTLAQDAGPQSPCDAVGVGNVFAGLICKIGNILNSIIPLLITLAVIYFIWGVIHYAIARDESAKTEGRGAMINGLIALMVIVSVWGLVNFIKDFIGIDVEDSEIQIPCVPSPQSGIFCPEPE